METRKTRIVVDLKKGSAPSLVLKIDQRREIPKESLDLAHVVQGVAKHTWKSQRSRSRLLDLFFDAAREKKEIFLPIEEKKFKRKTYAAELARVAAVGVLMLGIFHSINIYQRGFLLKDHVLVSAAAGYEGLLKAGAKVQSIDTLAQAEVDFQKASSHFTDALNLIQFLSANQNIVVSRESTVQSVQGILNAGQKLSEAGTDFIQVLKKMQDMPGLMLEPMSQVENLEPESILKEEGRVNEVPRKSLTDELKSDLETVRRANDKLEIARDYLSLVDKNLLPLEVRPKFAEGGKKLDQVIAMLASAREKIPIFLKLLGDRYPHRYLILLQNDTEARPTGGFIGSYLLVDFNDGRIENMQFHDVYASDGQLKSGDESIQVPEDIAKITSVWRMRDANYSPDFAISAEKAAWFLQKQYGPSVDSVLAVNQSFLRDLFDLTGPIRLKGFDAEFTKENYQTILSYIVESKIDGAEDPKKILREFIPAFQKKLFSSNSMKQALGIFHEGLRRKDILLYSRDREIQELFENLGFAGKVRRSDQNEDYLSVISTSVGGNKSDLYIRQSLQHVSQVEPDGNVTNELSLTREHTWSQEAERGIRSMISQFGYSELPEFIKFILGSGKNKSVVKVYVPLGSALLGAQDIDLKEIAVREDNDLNKTFFMFEMEVSPGTSRTVKLRYKLPRPLDLRFADTYKLFVQKQPGLVPTIVQKYLRLSPEFHSLATYPSSFRQTGQLLMFEKNMEADFHLAALIAR